MSGDKQSREGLILRVLWMALLAIVWQIAELVLVAVVLLQLILRLINGVPSRALMDFGDSLSQYLAQIGRFGCFHSDEKPWPFADWPSPREPQGEGGLPPPAAAPATAGAAGAAAAVGEPSAEPQRVEPASGEVTALADAGPTAVEPAAEAEVEAGRKREPSEVDETAGPEASKESKA